MIPPTSTAYLEELRRIAASAGSPEGRLRVLEWGPGWSTFVLAEEVCRRPEGEVLAIEHQEEYRRLLQEELSKPTRQSLRNVISCQLLDLNGPLTNDLDKEANQLNYSSYPLSKPPQWDMIVVDGRRRVECLLTAALVSGPNTIVLLHDYRRLRYVGALSLFEKRHEGLEYLRLMGSRLSWRWSATQTFVAMASTQAEAQEADLPGLFRRAWTDKRGNNNDGR